MPLMANQQRPKPSLFQQSALNMGRSLQSETQAPSSNYLTTPCDFLGSMEYAIDLPSAVPTYKCLSYAPRVETYCSYRPTLAELEVHSAMLDISRTGPPVELLNSAAAYGGTSRRKQALHPDDAALLEGLIPGFDRISKSSEPPQNTAASTHMESGHVSPHSISLGGAKNLPPHAGTLNFVHPTKKGLRPIKSLPVLPHKTLWKNRYIQASLQDVPLAPATKASEKTSALYPNFFLVPANPENKQHSDQRDFAMYAQDSDSSDSGSAGDPQSYHFVKYFSARFPNAGDKQAFVLDVSKSFFLPGNEGEEGSQGENTEGQCAYLFPLHGNKVLFTNQAVKDTRQFSQAFKMKLDIVDV